MQFIRLLDVDVDRIRPDRIKSCNAASGECRGKQDIDLIEPWNRRLWARVRHGEESAVETDLFQAQIAEASSKQDQVSLAGGGAYVNWNGSRDAILDAEDQLIGHPAAWRNARYVGCCETLCIHDKERRREGSEHDGVSRASTLW